MNIHHSIRNANPPRSALVLAVSLVISMSLSAQVVATTGDSGPGSLRQAIADATIGATITFTNTLSGQTITLTSGQMLVTNSVTIDASELPAGITIDGNANSRLFELAVDTTNVLNNLTLTNGTQLGWVGGAILNFGTLAITGALWACRMARRSFGPHPV